ncbi:patatin-like phospholipase family protein [Streptomyces sp. NPDC001002]
MNKHEAQSGSEAAPTHALVLGGGGPVGASWTSALLNGLASAGLPVADSDVVIGTSAGAVVGAWLTIQADGLASVPELMRERAKWHAAKAGSGQAKPELLRRMAEAASGGEGSALSIAQAAVAAIPPISADQAKALWQSSLPQGEWSSRLRIVSVNATTGIAHAWSNEDGLPLGVAVSSSTAAPGAAPAVVVDDVPWVDGGVRSGTNADLLVDSAEGDGRLGLVSGTGGGKVLIVAPMQSEDIVREEASLTERGFDVRIIIAERFYQTPFGLLDPRFIDAAVETGTRQAREAAAELVRWWNQ